VIQHCTELLLDALVAERSVQGFTTDDAIAVIFGSTIGGRDQVFDARLALWNGRIAEETPLTLQKQKALELLHGDAEQSR
jgi:hypothetical protein